MMVDTASADSSSSSCDDETNSHFECLECGVKFKSRRYLHNHLLHHIKQPSVVLQRIAALPPIKLTIKAGKDNSFAIVTSKTDTASMGTITEETSLPLTSPAPAEETVVQSPETVGLSEVTDTAVDDFSQPNDTSNGYDEELTDNLNLEVSEDSTETNGSITAEMDIEQDQLANEIIPGGEPTPPPETTDLPKLRVKTGLYSNTSSNDNTSSIFEEIRTPGAGESESNILTTLMITNNDRAKDFGFTTIDPDFSFAQEAPPSNVCTTQPYSTAVNSAITSSSALSTLGSLPVQKLAEQVSRLQTNQPNGLHQQNVLINIQQFQPPPGVHHAYSNVMYPQQVPPPQPMVYQHQAHTIQGAPAPGYSYHPPNQQYYQPQPRQPPPQYNMATRQHTPHIQPQPRAPPPMGNHHMKRPPPSYTMLSQNQPPRLQRMPRPVILHQPRTPGSMSRGVGRPRGPALTPIAPRGTRGPAPNMAMKRGMDNGPIAANYMKRTRMEPPKISKKTDDADCQLIMISKQTNGPQIQSVQGNVTEPNNLANLPEPRTNPMKTPPPLTRIASTAAEADKVADVLASRGITITTTPKQKEGSSSPPSSSRNTTCEPISINLNSHVSIIPRKKDPKENVSTVDLTDESELSAAKDTMKPPPPPLLPATSGQFECHLCPNKFQNTTQLMRHRNTYHRTSNAPEFGIPLIDLKSPGITQRLSDLGIFHYIPLPNNANADGMFALPILSPANVNYNKRPNASELMDSILTLGPIKPIARPST